MDAAADRGVPEPLAEALKPGTKRLKEGLPSGCSHHEGRHALPVGLAQGPPQLGIWCPAPEEMLALRGSRRL